MKHRSQFQTHKLHNETRDDAHDEDIVIVDDSDGPEEINEQQPKDQKPSLEQATIAIPPHKPRFTLIAGTALLAIAIFAAGYWLGLSETRKTNPRETSESVTNAPLDDSHPNEIIRERSFTGVPLSVVIDNHEDALPQRGLERAAIIWETLTEGDITRCLAVFTDDIPEIIGPVRSARTYLNTLANQYGGLFLHVGGNDLALDDIEKGEFSFTDVNEFSHGSTFYRDRKRPAPHNVFTTRQQIESFRESKDIPTTTLSLFPTSKSHGGGNRIDRVSLPYSRTHTDTIEWNGTGWIKKHNGAVWKDETGAPLVFDSVILISAQDETGFHPNIPELRRYLFDQGGEALLLRDGVSLAGKWIFSHNRISILAADNTPLGFKDGSILAILIPQTIYTKTERH